MSTKVPPLALDSTKDFSALVPAAFQAANAAYAQANSTVILVSEVFNKANTAADSGSNANAAFLQANTAIDNAAGASLYANAAFLHANAAFLQANTGGAGADQFARDTANASFIQANAAFEQANTGGASIDQVARDIANTALIQANTDIISLSMPGNITSPMTGNARYYPTNTIVINTVYANLGEAPTGNFTFIIKKNGTSIGNTFTLSSAVMTPNVVNVSLTTSDYLTLDVTGVNGSNLNVRLKYSY